MAVVQATIKAALDALSVTMKTAPMSDSDYNNALAGIIRNAILSASLSVPGTGLTSPSGAVTGSSTTGSLS
jgi:hypothetical protein